MALPDNTIRSATRPDHPTNISRARTGLCDRLRRSREDAFNSAFKLGLQLRCLGHPPGEVTLKPSLIGIAGVICPTLRFAIWVPEDAAVFVDEGGLRGGEVAQGSCCPGTPAGGYAGHCGHAEQVGAGVVGP